LFTWVLVVLLSGCRLLWQLGERKRPLVGVGWQHAAVYRQVVAPADNAAAAAADAAADAAAAPAAETAHFEQVQSLQQQTTTDKAPARLESLTLLVETRDGPQQLHLALPPVDVTIGRRKPLWYVTRYNKTWVEAAAALVLPDRQLNGGFSTPATATPGSSSRLAGTPGTGARNNSSTAAPYGVAGIDSSSSLRRNLFGAPVVAAAAAAAAAATASPTAGSRGQFAVLEHEEDDDQLQQQQHGEAYGSQFSSQGSNNALLLGSPYSSSRVGSQLSTPQQQQRIVVPKLYLTAVDGYSGRVEFLENVLDVYRLK
jgi:hypothetical protein